MKDRRVSFSLQSIRILILSSAFHPFTFHSSRFFFDLLIASPLYTLLSCILGILFVLLFCCLLKYGVLNQSYRLELPALFILFAHLCTVLRVPPSLPLSHPALPSQPLRFRLHRRLLPPLLRLQPLLRALAPVARRGPPHALPLDRDARHHVPSLTTSHIASSPRSCTSPSTASSSSLPPLASFSSSVLPSLFFHMQSRCCVERCGADCSARRRTRCTPWACSPSRLSWP